MSSVRTTVADGVGTITLAVPERRNCLSLEMLNDIADALDAWKADDSVAAVVLTGGEEVFCAGLDLKLQSSFTDETRDSYCAVNLRAYGALMDYPKPTIAAMAGPALGGGLELAIFCDIRVCADNAVMGLAQIKFGLTSYFSQVYRVVGMSQAKLLTFTGERVDCQEALRIGLIDRLVPAGTVVRTATEMARTIAETSVRSAMLNKQIALRSPQMDPIGALTYETLAYQQVIHDPAINARIAEAFSRIGSRSR